MVRSNPNRDGDTPPDLGDTDRHLIHAAIRQLHDSQRAAIELAFFHGLTCREVALRLDEAESTVRSGIRSGLRQLRASLHDHFVAAAPPTP